MSTVAVAGSTGAAGTPLVRALRSRGHRVVELARSRGVDLRTARLDQALQDADTVVDVSSVLTTRRRTAVEFFGQTTQRLLAAAEQVGVRHYVVLSIVGVDDIDYGYYAGKRVQERLVRSAGVAHTILRATQFHEFAAQMLHRMSFGPVAVLPAMQSQPVSAAEVADVLADLVDDGRAGAPSRAAPLELAGPEGLTLIDMVRRYQRRIRDRRVALSLPVPGRAGWLMRHGGLLPHGSTFRTGGVTFEQWLSGTAGSPIRSA